MKKIVASVSVATFAALINLTASVSVQFQAADFTDILGDSLVDGALGVFVVDKTGEGFLGLSNNSADLNGSTLTTGQTLGGGNIEILALVGASDIGTGGSGFADSFTISYGGDFGVGDEFGFYWFPSISSAGTSIDPGTEYGFYRSSTVDSNAGADIAFVAPADGFSYSLFTFDETIDGSAPGASAFQAQFVSAVPEPSTYAALAGLLALGYVATRRRKA